MRSVGTPEVQAVQSGKFFGVDWSCVLCVVTVTRQEVSSDDSADAASQSQRSLQSQQRDSGGKRLTWLRVLSCSFSH